MFWFLQIWQLSIKTSKLTIFSIVFCEGYCVKNSPSPICANLCSWKNFLIKIEVFYTFAEKITAGSTKVAIWDHFWKKLSFMKTYISQAMFSFSLFQTSLIYFFPIFLHCFDNFGNWKANKARHDGSVIRLSDQKVRFLFFHRFESCFWHNVSFFDILNTLWIMYKSKYKSLID